MSINLNHLDSVDVALTEDLQPGTKVIRESHVYNDLATSARQENALQFGLLLSMVSQDAVEFDQFKQVSSPNTFKDVLANDIFDIVPTSLYGAGNQTNSYNQNKSVNTGHFKDVQLALSMRPQPLVEGASELDSDIERQIYGSLEYNLKAKYAHLNNPKEEVTMGSGFDNEQVSAANSNENNIHSVYRPNSMDIDLWFKTISKARSLDLVS